MLNSLALVRDFLSEILDVLNYDANVAIMQQDDKLVNSVKDEQYLILLEEQGSSIVDYRTMYRVENQISAFTSLRRPKYSDSDNREELKSFLDSLIAEFFDRRRSYIADLPCWNLDKWTYGYGISISEEFRGHYYVLKASAQNAAVYTDFDEQSSTTGKIEFWTTSSSSSATKTIWFGETYQFLDCIYLKVINSKLYWVDSDSNLNYICDFDDSATWKHILIDFDLDSTFSITIDGGTTYENCGFKGSPDYIKWVEIRNTTSGEAVYLDAVDISWSNKFGDYEQNRNKSRFDDFISLRGYRFVPDSLRKNQAILDIILEWFG